MESRCKESNKRNDREKEEKLEQERLRKVEEEALKVQQDLEQQKAISKAEEDARVAIHNLNREVSLSSVSSETDKALEHAADLGNDSTGSVVAYLPPREDRVSVVDKQVSVVEEQGSFEASSNDTDTAMKEKFDNEHQGTENDARVVVCYDHQEVPTVVDKQNTVEDELIGVDQLIVNVD